MEEIGVGIIGAGVRGVYYLGRVIVELNRETGFVISGVCDLLRQRSVEAKGYLEALYRDHHIERQIRIYDDYRQMLDDDQCRVVLVTSFTSDHREHAVEALRIGKEVYLDKPIAVTLEDAAEIVAAAKDNPLVMGFTRRYERSWMRAKQLLDSGAIGSLQMMQINSVIPYSRYLQTWHRRRELSGGSLNDKGSHLFDVFNWMSGEKPASVTAAGGRSSVFPEEQDAPESCRVCSRVCEYRRSPDRISDGGFVLDFDSWKHAADEVQRIDSCVYAPGADINDHAVVTVVYPSGVKASLFFAIFGPDTMDQETLLLLGERGKIAMSRLEGQVELYSDFGRNHEVFDCRDEEFETSHFGADRNLVRTLRAFHDGEKPVASAEDGYHSLRMVLAAQESIQNGSHPVRFEPVSEPAV